MARYQRSAADLAEGLSIPQWSWDAGYAKAAGGTLL